MATPRQDSALVPRRHLGHPQLPLHALHRPGGVAKRPPTERSVRRARDSLRAMRGVVAAGHPLTAQAGADVLRAGGNAVDAAVAAVLMSFVTESPLTGPGAGGVILVHTPRRGDHPPDFFLPPPWEGLHPPPAPPPPPHG